MAMGKRRQLALTRSVQRAIFRNPETYRKNLISRILSFFHIFYITLVRYENATFRQLRNGIWEIDEEEYKDCFLNDEGAIPLIPMGDLGLSGSTFFRTSNYEFLVKSLPRYFEHSFFREDFFMPYCNYMSCHASSLLVWITDYVYAPHVTIGSLMKTTPAHHIIMENMLCGKEKDPAADAWETYDLKPVDYFYPERDLVPEAFVSEETMSRLADSFEDKIRLSRSDYENVKRDMEADTEFLASVNVVDYSLFLIRFPASSKPGVVGRKNKWRVGVPSMDGKWKYRAVILDFFWAKHKFQPQMMTGVVKTFNVIGRQGPMTITTTAEEYRKKFLDMVNEIMEVHDSN